MFWNFASNSVFNLILCFFALWLIGSFFELRKELRRLNRKNLYDLEMKKKYEKLNLKIINSKSYDDLVNAKNEVVVLMKQNEKNEFKSVGYHYITLLILIIAENQYFK